MMAAREVHSHTNTRLGTTISYVKQLLALKKGDCKGNC
jgi:hypothetical protein